MRMRASWAVSLAVLLLAGGCGIEHFPANLPVSLEELNEIRDDANLTAQEKRDELAGLGIDQVTINGLLRAERTGNQFGGTLTTAWELVNAGRLADLTPDEVQLYADAVETTFADNEAQAIVNLFTEANLNTADEVAAFLDNPANELDPLLTADDVRAVFVDTDPDDLIDQLP